MLTSAGLAQVDLNLLGVFRALDQERHVTRAAARLGLSQPALSHALRRLREAFGDDLFVKTPKGMVPTPRALELSPLVAEVLGKIDDILLQRKGWDLRTARREFRVQSTDLIEGLLVPRLVRSMAEAAPLTSVAFTSARFALPKEELESGKTDLAIAGFFGELPPGFYSQKVFSDEFAVAVRSGHPRLGKKTKLSIDDLVNESHLMIAPGGELSGQLDRELTKLRRKRHVSVGLSSFMGSGGMLAETDCILVGPTKMFQVLAKGLDLKVFAPPVPLRPLQIVQVWHERNHRDAHHKWLRENVRALLGD